MDSYLRNKGEWDIRYKEGKRRNGIEIIIPGEENPFLREYQSLEGMYTYFSKSGEIFILAKAFSRKYAFLITKTVNDYDGEFEAESREVLDMRFVSDSNYSFSTSKENHHIRNNGIETTHSLFIFEKRKNGKMIDLDLDNRILKNIFGEIVLPLGGIVSIHPTIDGEHFFIQTATKSFVCFSIKDLFKLYEHTAKRKFDIVAPRNTFQEMKEKYNFIDPLYCIGSLKIYEFVEGIYFFSANKYLVMKGVRSEGNNDFIFCSKNDVVATKSLQKFDEGTTKVVVVRKNKENVVFIVQYHCTEYNDGGMNYLFNPEKGKRLKIKFMILDEDGKNDEIRERKFRFFIDLVSMVYANSVHIVELFTRVFSEGFFFLGVYYDENDYSFFYDIYEGEIYCQKEKDVWRYPNLSIERNIYLTLTRGGKSLCHILGKNNGKYLKTEDKELQISLLLEGITL